MRSRIAPVVVVLLLVVAAGLAQSQQGEITGVVRNVSGSVLPGEPCRHAARHRVNRFAAP